MIISHKNKYLFVELPRTGSSAISRELRENYDGERILRKHSTYLDFLKIASPEEKNYFVFSCIRNPLDDAVSWYYKMKSNHKGVYTNKIKPKKRKAITERLLMRIFYDIHNTNADFEKFFMKYYFIPYDRWSSLMQRYYDFVIRFENLQEDFARALQLIGLEPKGPLPVINPTAMRKRDYLSYYSPAIIPRAKRIFGPYMKQWGYEFPPEWGETHIPWWNQVEFEFLKPIRNFYWKFLRNMV